MYLYVSAFSKDFSSIFMMKCVVSQKNLHYNSSAPSK